MKRTLITILVLACALTAYAQQTLMGTAVELKSPDIHDDNSVTFRVYAPKAVSVRLTGDFLPHHIADNNGYVTEVSNMYPDKIGYIGLFSGAMGVRNNPEVEKKIEVLFSKKPKLYFVACGTADPIVKGSYDYVEFLQSHNYPCQVLWTGGAHTWKNWRNYLVVFGSQLFK